MNYNIFINPEYSSNENINNYNRKISNLISDSLNSMNISNIIVNMNNDKDKIDYINRYINGNNIIVTIGNTSEGIEIVYGINRNDNLVSRLANNLEDNNFKVSKYYQRRSSTNTTKDYDNIINSFPNNESIIIRYDNTIINRLDELSNVITNTIKSYLGLANDTYIVKKGDNIYSIARKFNTTVDNIKRLNNLTSNYIDIGQKLIIKSIPSTINTNIDSDYYIVKTGDTLYSIARKYNTSIDNIKSINSLTSNVINIGMKLKLPSNNSIEYIVKKGDNLYSISKKYNTTVKDIMNINNLNSTNLSINQKLIIPK